MVRPIRLMVSAEAIAACLTFLAGYACVGLSGIFRAIPVSVIRILYEPPALAALLFLLVIAIGRLSGYLMSGRSSGRRSVLVVLMYTGTAFVAAGLIVSSQTRFEGRILLPEGEHFSSDTGGYIPGSVYSRRFAVPPRIGLAMERISPGFIKKGTGLWNISSEVLYTDYSGPDAKTVTINSIMPTFSRGVYFRIRDFGYAPLFRLSDYSGKVLEESYPMLKLFPPGAEDSFRIEKQPYTIYLKYYPDRTMIMDNDVTPPQGYKGVLYKLRVARNLAVVSNGYIAASDIVQVDNQYISFEDLRMWVEVEIVRDYGLFLIMPGIAIVVLTLVWSKFRRINLLREILSEENR